MGVITNQNTSGSENCLLIPEVGVCIDKVTCPPFGPDCRCPNTGAAGSPTSYNESIIIM